MSRASLSPIVEKCSLKGVGNLVKVTDRYDTYFNILYYLIVLTTRHAVANSFPSPLRIPFGLNETIVIIGCLRGFHLINDSISELSVITPVLRILFFFIAFLLAFQIALFRATLLFKLSAALHLHRK